MNKYRVYSASCTGGDRGMSMGNWVEHTIKIFDEEEDAIQYLAKLVKNGQCEPAFTWISDEFGKAIYRVDKDEKNKLRLINAQTHMYVKNRSSYITLTK